MRTLTLTLIAILCALKINAQGIQFEQVIPPPPAPQIIADFDGVGYGFIAFSDVDGDNDQDVLITGQNGSNKIAKLYTNNGSGSYTEVKGTPFDGVAWGSIAFADIDGDNDQDVLITGHNSSGTNIAKLYTNDGTGNYSEVTETPFEGAYNGSIAFADVDGDNDQDVLITGENSSGIPIAKLYTNNGTGNYSEVTETPFDGARSGSSIAFSDVDGDNDQDVLITGVNSSGTMIAKLYANDGTGNYSEAIGTPFEGVNAGSIAFADVDGDNDQDVLITGQSINSRSTKLYTNDGVGGFNEVTGTPFDGVIFSSIAFSDVDGDNDQDVLIIGHNSLSNTNIAKLYNNDGTGNYSEVIEAPFDGVMFSSVAFADVDGDTDQDVIITGLNSSYIPTSILYANDGTGNYIEIPDTPFEGVYDSSIAFADVDGDNDQDILITGQNISGTFIAKLYTNNGSGGYIEVIGTPFDSVVGSIAFADVDNDGDQDLLITGANSSDTPIAKLYTNDGFGVYSEVIGTPFEGVWQSSIAFADVDGDSDQDVLITGGISSGTSIAKLYTNDGFGVYSEVIGTPFEGVWQSSIAFADIDGDSDQDLLITGANSSFTPITKLYTNNGSGNFTEVLDTPFEGVYFGSIAFADVDGDNDQDVLISGNNVGLHAKLYSNDGLGNYKEVTGTPFEGVHIGSVAFTDIDGDSDQDVLITGSNDVSSIAKFYINDGVGGYSELKDTPFEGVEGSSIAFADIDGDSDQDVFISGWNSTSDKYISKLYRNICVSTIWYADLDGDTYGDNGNTLTTQCHQPIGYVLDNTDCDDGNAALNPTTVWYADNDNDGYGDNAINLTQCSQPIDYVLDNTDCDDTDATINPGSIDVAGSGIDVNCDGQYLWYTDADDDGYGTAATTSSANSTAGVNESATSNDCDDTDAAINPATIWFADKDGDGYGDNAAILIQCSQPTGYVLDNTDCNDTDAVLNPATVWYADTDNDGYGDSATTLTQCSQPIGYVLDNTDCNDSNGSLNPSEIDVAGSGIDANCDGQYLWYTDADADGYGTTATTSSTNSTAGVNESAINDDCDDTDVRLNPTTVWYADTDNDGYGDSATTLTQCIQPASYVLDNTDCDDTDVDVYPSAPTLPDGKDNDCDGIIDKEAQTITFNTIDIKVFEDGNLSLSATASTGLLVTYEITSDPATVSGSTITFTGIGTVTVAAIQTGDDFYLPAEEVSQNFEVVTITGLFSEVDKISFYPNPVTNWLTINTPNLDINQIQLLQVDGRLVEEFNKTNRLLNVSNIVSGTYLLKITTANKVLIERVVKK